MSSLLIFRTDQGSFSESQSLEKLSAIGVRNLRQNSMPGAAISGHFEWANEMVIVELTSRLNAFAVSDCSPAAYEFAVRLQAHFQEALRIVDQSYSFDFELRRFNTARHLQNAIESPDP